MSIRLKLAGILVLGMALASAGTAALFLPLQMRVLRQEEREREAVFVAGVTQMAQEAAWSGNPLMLLDFLDSMMAGRPELVGCRVRIGGKWHARGKAPEAGAPEEARLRVVELPAQGGPPDKALGLELFFSKTRDAEREQAVRSGLAKNLRSAAACMLLVALAAALPLSWTLTRRLRLLENAFERLGRGESGVRVPEGGQDEVSRLASGFNRMSVQLRELEAMKETFVASVTHELRSPLVAIESLVRSLLDRGSNLLDEQRQDLERVMRNAARLGHFVTNLLEMSRIRRGKLRLNPSIADVGPVVSDAASFFEPNARERGIGLSVEVEPGLPKLRCDPHLVSQAATNLISNALKFTPRGGSVQVRLRRAPSKAGGLELLVQDNGSGISKSTLARLFKPFERGENPFQAQGSGLGLAICRAIAELHGGTVEAESEPGKGSRFLLILPAGAGPPA